MLARGGMHWTWTIPETERGAEEVKYVDRPTLSHRLLISCTDLPIYGCTPGALSLDTTLI